MRTFRLVVAYDGTDFHGWQRQPGQRTVQGVLERALGEVLGGVEVSVQGAGRTDAGVHARGQVASFAAATTLPAGALAPALNARLAGDVRVVAALEAAAEFDARRSAAARRYAYRLLERDDVLLQRIAWRPRLPYDRAGLGCAAAALEGGHDFTSLRATGSSETPPVCVVREARWRPWEGGLRLDVTADRFLYHMVRNIVGTALAVSRETDPAAAMAAILAARDRAAAGPTAPPHGLCLEQVLYPEDER
ncbi:MAG: tRNA pseudouridine(38-40) synthase TruA [Candidatus Eisenbacteria bacterium]|nr:tRNA pseudouridine(38-40) synthase TruA [Candidatus Eisenbacteria bacterium]